MRDVGEMEIGIRRVRPSFDAKFRTFHLFPPFLGSLMPLKVLFALNLLTLDPIS